MVVRIITNPGSNLDDDEVHRHDVEVMPQKVVVDGISHDTRNDLGNFEKIDRWVKSAQRHPTVQGTAWNTRSCGRSRPASTCTAGRARSCPSCIRSMA